MNDTTFKDQWAIVELMGHRKLAGKLTEVVVAGAPMLRIDIPASDDPAHFHNQFYGASSVYCITPCTEDLARGVAKRFQPSPVTEWDLPRQLAGSKMDDDRDEWNG